MRLQRKALYHTRNVTPMHSNLTMIKENLLPRIHTSSYGFFLGLEKWKIHQFKANYLNSLQVTLIDLPEDLNKMFALANNWKAKGTDRRGLSQYLYMQLKWRKIRKEIRIIIMRITCKRLRRMMPKSHVLRKNEREITR